MRFEQDRVRIPVKTHLKRLYSCGPCSDPQATWTLRITPDGVEDLGLELASPELGAADELMDRVIRRQDTSKLASPGAAKSLAAVLEGQLYDDGKDEGEPDYFLGMLTGWRVEPRSGGATLLLSTDEMPCTEFAFERRAAGLFFTGVTAVAWAEGEPNPCWRP